MSNLLLNFIILLIVKQISPFEYPKATCQQVVEDHFGVKVEDPYRWLENPNSKETKEFIKQQNQVTRPYLDSNKNRDNIKKSFTQLYNFPKYGTPVKYGSKYFYSINSGLQNQGVIYTKNSLNDKPVEFLDPNKLSSDGTTSLQFWALSRDGKWCAYGTSKGGSDWVSIRIKNVESGTDLPEILTKIKFSYPEWTPDNKGFFYAQYDQYNGTGDGTDTEVPLNQTLFYHRLKTQQSNDVLIARFPSHPKWIIGSPVVTDDGNYLHLFPQEGTSNSSWFWADIRNEKLDKEIQMIPINENSDAEYFFVANDNDTVYIRTNKGASNYRFVKLNIKNPDEKNWVNLIPESKTDVLTNVIAVNQNYLAVIYTSNVINIIQIHQLSTGKHLWDVETPIGTVSEAFGKRSDDYLFYKITSFLMPGTIYHYNFKTQPHSIQLFAESKLPSINPNDYVTNQVFFRSKDKKVKVPMFLVHRKNIKLDGNNPTLLYGYGGFNINIMPSYDPLAAFFIRNLNGIYALANIRGGGENGEEWHRGGMLFNKQNVFDDFASAAEYLINNKYTKREKLTINGRSNGGLLVGASSNQRPDLFGCALANVGVLDMLRFHKFTIGHAWIEEYGDPDVKEHFFNIYKYSPLHNIPGNATQYPAMLVLTGDHDDRVVPAHSLKFIAELQHKLGAKLVSTPLMIRVDTNSGHGSGKPISKWIDEFTDIASFVINSLKINYNSNDSQNIKGGIKGN